MFVFILKETATVNILKFGTLFLFCSQIKCWFIKTGILRILVLVRLANREDLDQSDLGPVLFVKAFLAGNFKCSKF